MIRNDIIDGNIKMNENMKYFVSVLQNAPKYLGVTAAWLFRDQFEKFIKTVNKNNTINDNRKMNEKMKYFVSVLQNAPFLLHFSQSGYAFNGYTSLKRARLETMMGGNPIWYTKLRT